MTIRKNFVFDESVAKHLEELAQKEGKTQTQIAQEAIEERYKSIERDQKLTALKNLAGAFTGKIADVDIKELRSKRALTRAK